MNASLDDARRSQSLLIFLFWSSQEIIFSITQRRGRTTKPFLA
jgi:hypothetical protein